MVTISQEARADCLGGVSPPSLKGRAEREQKKENRSKTGEIKMRKTVTLAFIATFAAIAEQKKKE